MSHEHFQDKAAKKNVGTPALLNNGNYGGPKVRDCPCQLIRLHQLDANLVKSYAVDFCGTKTLRDAFKINQGSLHPQWPSRRRGT